MIWANMNVHLLRMLPSYDTSFSFLANWFFRRRFVNISLYVLLCKYSTPLWPHSTPGEYDLIKLESKLPEDALTQAAAFLAFGFWENVWKIPTDFQLHLTIFLWKCAWPWILTNLNSLNLRMRCAKFGWNQSSGSGDKVDNVINKMTNRRTPEKSDQNSLLQLPARSNYKLKERNQFSKM